MEESKYREALDRVIRHAHEHHNFITEEDYGKIFADIGMNGREDELTRNYLNGINIKFGVWDGNNYDEPQFSEEDGKYLNYYLEEIERLPKYGEDEIKKAKELAISKDDEEARTVLMNHYLKNVVDIARLYIYQALPAEDLIGEGNIGLMTAIRSLVVLDNIDEVDSFVGKFIMDAMDAAIYEDTNIRKSMEDAVSHINDINDKAKKMSEEIHRSVTVAELSEETGITVEEIAEAMRLTGNGIEGLIP